MLIKSPIDLLKSVSTADNAQLLEEFMNIIKAVYRYEIFKPIMDLSSTLAQAKRLKFVAHPKEFYALDEGNCVTIEGGTFDKLANVFRAQKSYKITIKKITSEVIIHEIGHMIEKESGVVLDSKFMQTVYADVSNSAVRNISLKSAIKQVMVDEVKPYERSHQASELFTRFFQLLAMSKEVAGYAAQYGYKLEDMYRSFPNTVAWLADYFYPKILRHIDAQIARSSASYIVPLEEIKHQWAQEKIRPLHGANSTSTQSSGLKWSSNIKSIKD